MDKKIVWEEIQDSSDIWNPEKDGAQELVATLVEVRSSVGPNKSMLYTFESEDGSRVSVWGNTALDRKLRAEHIGKLCRVKFLGREMGKNGREYKKFSVQVGNEV